MRMNKILSVIISAVLIIPGIGLNANAYEIDNTNMQSDVAVVVADESRQTLISSGSSITVDRNAVKSVREELSKHESYKIFGVPLPITTVEAEIKTDKGEDTDYRNEYAEKLLDEAMEHTGVPNEGDYMKRQMNGYVTSFDTSKSGYLKITYAVSFFTSKAQEEEMDEKVDEIIDSLHLDGKNEYEKIKAIYDYLCDNVVYDDMSLYLAMSTQGILHNPIGHSAYGGLCKGTCVCQGYAAAFYRLTLEAGIDSRVIFGEAPGGGHAWNIVRLYGKYYLLDSTWDAGQSEYSYFLKSEADFPDHEPDDEHKTSEWLKKYPIASESFDPSKDNHKSDDDKFNTIGDVDGSGNITSGDSLLALRISVGLDLDAHTELADADQNGRVDSADALSILRYSVGLPTDSKIGMKI